MRYALVVPDGAADRPCAALDGRTPFEVADLPHFHRLAREGRLGLVNNVPDGMAPGSDVACLSLMGYDPRANLTGRAALEAASRGVAVPPDGAVFRANTVTVEDGRMKDYSAGHIDQTTARELIEGFDARLALPGVRLFTGIGYRHLCVFDRMDAHGIPGRRPPHDIMGQPVLDYPPDGGGADARAAMRAVEDAARAYFADAEPCARRRAEGHEAPTQVWLWGGATAMKLRPFAAIHGVEGALISAVDLMRGIGALAGLRLVDVPGATGYYDTNYEGKGAAALDALRAAPFVCVHVEAPDEAGHNGDAAAKVAALEAMDRHILRPLMDEAARAGDVRLLVSPDHPTPLSLRTHSADPVPYAFWGAGVAPNGAERFTEKEAARMDGPVAVGADLMARLVTP